MEQHGEQQGLKSRPCFFIEEGAQDVQAVEKMSP
jgi:hypothetical protein